MLTTVWPKRSGGMPNAHQGNALRCDSIEKRFQDVRALRGVTVTIPPGLLVALLGPSGSGKTTLGEIISGVLAPDSGRVLLGDRDVTRWPAHKRRIPVVPQEWDLFPHLNALENVAFGLRAEGLTRSHGHKKARALLERVGLQRREAAMPHELSGGQQQRIAFARALATNSRFLVLDEPFANVDQETRRDLRNLVREAAAEGRGVLFVTHDQGDALSLADQVVCLLDGHIMMIGTPEEIYLSPVDLDVALLSGPAFVVPYRLVEGDGLALVGDPSAGVSPVRLSSRTSCIPRQGFVVGRPSWLQLAPENAVFHLTGRVEGCVFVGDHYLISVDDDGSRLSAVAPRPYEAGSFVRLAVNSDVRLPVLSPATQSLN